MRQPYAVDIEKIEEEDTYKSKRTFISEVEAIDIILKIIDLVQVLHRRDIIHTNFNPNEIFLKNSDIDGMCFMSLFSCHWNTFKTLRLKIAEDS